MGLFIHEFGNKITNIMGIFRTDFLLRLTIENINIEAHIIYD